MPEICKLYKHTKQWRGSEFPDYSLHSIREAKFCSNTNHTNTGSEPGSSELPRVYWLNLLMKRQILPDPYGANLPNGKIQIAFSLQYGSYFEHVNSRYKYASIPR